MNHLEYQFFFHLLTECRLEGAVHPMMEIARYLNQHPFYEEPNMNSTEPGYHIHHCLRCSLPVITSPWSDATDPADPVLFNENYYHTFCYAKMNYQSPPNRPEKTFDVWIQAFPLWIAFDKMVKTREKYIRKEFLRIFSRGVQWEIAETEGIHKPLKEICPTDDWPIYGKYHKIAARIFNARNYGWRVIGTCETPDTSLLTWDYEKGEFPSTIDIIFSMLDITPIYNLKPQRGAAS